MQWEDELPWQTDAYIGYCPICQKGDMLIFELRYKDGKYEHCMICKQEWKKGAN